MSNSNSAPRSVRRSRRHLRGLSRLVGVVMSGVIAVGLGLVPRTLLAFDASTSPVGASPMISGAPTATAASNGLLEYGGGPVVTGKPKVYLIFWGPTWGKVSTDSRGDLTFTGDRYGAAPWLQEMFKGLGTGGELWSGVMTQYCQGVAIGATSCPNTAPHVGYPSGGALAWAYYDNRSAPGSPSRDQIAAEAYGAALLIGDFSPSAQYFILSPSGMHPDGFNTPGWKVWCGWHKYVARPGGPAFTNLPYVMDIGTGYCGMGQILGSTTPLLDGYTVTASHEYAETLTDPQPLSGWDDPADGPQGENGDKCPPEWGTASGPVDIATATGTFGLSATWSNDTAECATAHAILPVYTTVPNLIGDTLTQVGQALYTAGLVTGSKTYKVDCGNIGLVTAQSPIAGTRLTAGSSVNITVGTKPSPPLVCS